MADPGRSPEFPVLDVHALKAVAFDLDDTLSASKAALDPAMATALVALLQRLPICIISGGRFEQFQTQVLDHLAAPEALLGRLHLMPTCGTRYYVRRGGSWVLVYAESLSPAAVADIRGALEASARRLGFWSGDSWGNRIEDRGGQVTFSALGQRAPGPAKAAWDPDGAKRRLMLSQLVVALPDFEVRAGGSTSVDVTRKGIDKAHGIRKLLERLGAAPGEVLFVGDRLEPGGNDHAVRATGVTCLPVTGWPETLTTIGRFVREWDRPGTPQFMSAASAK